MMSQSRAPIKQSVAIAYAARGRCCTGPPISQVHVDHATCWSHSLMRSWCFRRSRSSLHQLRERLRRQKPYESKRRRVAPPQQIQTRKHSIKREVPYTNSCSSVVCETPVAVHASVWCTVCVSAPEPEAVPPRRNVCARAYRVVCNRFQAQAVSPATFSCLRHSPDLCAMREQTLVEDGALARFLSTYVAPSPRWTSTCKGIMEGTAISPAQQAQDIFVWRNLFAHMTLRGTKGFYIDSGANEAHHGSNTWFFDKCLGWPGLCVEPNLKYGDALRRERSCTVVQECISDRDNVVLQMTRMGPLSRIGGRAPLVANVTCNTVQTMLSRVGQSIVDFWSLDVSCPACEEASSTLRHLCVMHRNI